MHQVSNLDLLHSLSSQPLGMIAETFMRPKMAMKYHLLPALAHELALARPIRGKAGELSQAASRARSVALLLETADPSWRELPKSWVFFGSDLESGIKDARENLADIFAKIHVEHPMRFLENFCAPLPDMAEWRRFFWLSDQEMNDFLAEKAKTIEMINADDEEDVPQE